MCRTNWNRPTTEIDGLMGLLEHYLSTERNKLIEQGVRFRTIGRTDALPTSALQWVRAAEQETAHLDKLQLTVALSYGGRSEIVDAVRGLVRESQDGKLQAEDIDEQHVQQYLYTHDLPDPDAPCMSISTGRSGVVHFCAAATRLCRRWRNSAARAGTRSTISASTLARTKAR